MKPIHLVIDGLAAHRLARLVVDEDSPASTWIRDQADRRLPAGWAPVVECRHCTGMWAALGLAGLRAIGLGWIAYPLAVAGATTLALEALTPPEVEYAEAQGPVQPPMPTVPFADMADRAYRALVGRALTGQERATGRTTTGRDGTDLPDHVERDLDDDEQRFGRLAR